MSPRSTAVLKASRNRTFRIFAAFAMALLVAGCATVSSVNSPTKSHESRGLIYRLPLKWIKVSMTVDATGARALSVEPTAAFGDPSQLFVARYRNNPVAHATMTLKADSNGLLQTDQAFVTDSNLSAGLVSLAEGIGRLSVGAPKAGAQQLGASSLTGQTFNPDDNPCKMVKTYIWTLNPDVDVSLENATRNFMLRCGLALTIKPLGGDVAGFAATGSPVTKGENAPGLFYRQALAYEVVLEDFSGEKPLSLHSLQMIPTKRSPTGFIPISRTLFAKNTTTLTFVDGMPSKVAVDQESEWLAIAKLPVDVIVAYTKGINDGFVSNKGVLDKKKEYLVALSQLSAQQAKTAACMAELAKPAPDPELVKTLCV